MWMQYRHNFSSNHGEWEWVDIVDVEPDVYIAMSNMKAEYDFSEHYRGVEIGYVVSKPPTEILKKLIEELSAQIKNKISYREKLTKMLESR